jgi:hypothetical protein
MKSLLFALLLGTAAPALAQAAPAQAPAETIDPQRLALARTTVDGIWPAGTYSKMMNQMMTGSMNEMMGSFMNMSEADVAKTVGVDAKAKPDIAPSKETIRERMRKEDPYFEERIRLTNNVLGEEMARVGAILEPKLREGLSKAVAKRFTPAQLTDINRFLATDSGRAFGADMMLLWVDPDVLKSMMGSIPELMKELPDMAKKIDAATAHLPKPKRKEPEKSVEDPKPDKD